METLHQVLFQGVQVGSFCPGTRSVVRGGKTFHFKQRASLQNGIDIVAFGKQRPTIHTVKDWCAQGNMRVFQSKGEYAFPFRDDELGTHQREKKEMLQFLHGKEAGDLNHLKHLFEREDDAILV